MLYFNTAKNYDLLFQNLVRGQSYALNCVVQSTEAAVANRKTSTYATSSWGTGNTTKDFIPTPVDPTICLSFAFATAIDDSIKGLILGFAQNVFSPGAATPITTGCIICQDDAKKTVNGYALPTNVTCTSARRRLKSLSNNRLLTTPPVATNTTTTPAAPAPVFSYTICAIPSVTCPTNLVATRRLRNLATAVSGLQTLMTARVQTALASPALMKTVLGVTVPAFTVQSVSDTKAPDVSSVTFTGSVELTGAFKVAAVYNLTTAYTCYWQVAPTANKPATGDAIRSCTSTTNCGSVTLQTPGFNAAGTFNPIPAIGTPHSVFFVCYNQVPGATLASAIVAAVSFTLACPSTQTLSGTTCVTPPTPTPVPSGPTSSNFLYLSLLMIISAILLLN
jgi:hypothetical protein